MSSVITPRKERPTPRTVMKNIGSWELGITLGRGGYGHVRSAKHRRTGENMACKILPALDPVKGWSEDQMLDAIESHKELVLLKALQGAVVPGIMGVEAFYTIPGWTYTIMPDYSKNLHRLPSNHPEVVVPFFRELLVSIKALHDLDIAHNDIKPSNILINERGSPVLLDFGFAQFSPHHHPQRPLGGTLAYSSPEKIADEEIDPQAADVWALGILLLEYLNIPLPYVLESKSDSGKVEFEQLVMHGEPTWHWHEEEGHIDGLAELVMWMLHPNPSLRPKVDDCLRHPYLNPPDLPSCQIDIYAPPSRARLAALPPKLPDSVLEDLLFMAIICGRFSIGQSPNVVLARLKGPNPTWEKRWVGMIYKGWVRIKEKKRMRQPVEAPLPKLRPIQLSPIQTTPRRAPGPRPPLVNKKPTVRDLNVTQQRLIPRLDATRPSINHVPAIDFGKGKDNKQHTKRHLDGMRPLPPAEHRCLALPNATRLTRHHLAPNKIKDNHGKQRTKRHLDVVPSPAAKQRRLNKLPVLLGPPRRPGLRSQTRV